MIKLSRTRSLKAILGSSLAIGLLVAGVIWWQRSPGHQGARGLLALGNDVHVYEISLGTHLRAKAGTIAQFDLRGLLKLHRLPSEDPRISKFEALLDDARLTSEQATAEARALMQDARSDFAKPMVLEIGTSGAIDTVLEDEDAVSQARSMLKSIIATMQVVTPPEAYGREWTSSESDTSGTYRAKYFDADDGRSLRKQKLEYASLAASGNTSLRASSTLTVSSSSVAFQFAASGHTQSLRSKESLVASGQFVDGIATDTTLNANYLRAEKKRDLSSGQARERLTKSTMPKLVKRADFSPESDRVKIAGRSFDALLAEAEKLPRGKDLQTASEEVQRKSRQNFVGMAALFRSSPAAVEEALDAVAEHGTEADSRVWNALAAAGSASAQDALRKIIEMPEWDMTQRRSQMIGLSMVHRPTTDTVDFLLARSDDPEQGEQARYGVGTAIHFMAESNPELADKYFTKLTSNLNGIKDPSIAAQVLRAVGNSESPRGYEVAKTFFEAADPQLRGAAAQAIRLVKSPEAAAALSVLAQDPDTGVRTDAVSALADVGPTDANVLLLQQIARTDASPFLRRQAISVLAQLANQRPELNLHAVIESIASESGS
jgi:hypothetical protein